MANEIVETPMMKQGNCHSILYIADGKIMQVGPFNDKTKMKRWFQRHAKDEFDIENQRAYAMSPDHCLTEIFDAGDLGKDGPCRTRPALGLTE